jgi:hypothetical protein
MEFWLSRSLSHELFLFHGGILAITKPFTRTFLFHDGILAIMKPFTRTFLFFHDGILAITKPFHEFFFHTVELRLSRSLFHEFFFHTVESRLSRSLFTKFSFTYWNLTKCTIWGKTLFIYITKSIYKGSTSLKTLPLNLEPPLQGKEYDPPYCNEIAEKKVNVFVPEITYRFLIRILLS